MSLLRQYQKYLSSVILMREQARSQILQRLAQYAPPQPTPDTIRYRAGVFHDLESHLNC